MIREIVGVPCEHEPMEGTVDGESPVEDMRASGELQPAERGTGSFSCLPDPAPVDFSGSDELQRVRDEERY
ncbi:hypothetical protein ACZ91_42310 [Streptomyces regensis]|uniref:Uncharacterized protein n=2 Tax=Prauserella rugosa TaxID=43354 RepID=A0A660CMT8_9PSEU|nr:hypothetical protein HQ32_01882 [Prauserella sp. Am3]KMS85440.1 hypothetical protein ACZ91_42310 [Streptomyces regensis]TWH22963.1 hypothetical protein JD82_04855 [Prauserella rugosa]